jgi:hypothetical protein
MGVISGVYLGLPERCAGLLQPAGARIRRR